MSRSFVSVVQLAIAMSGLALLPQVATATVGNCGTLPDDAPAGFNNQPCRNVCQEVGDELICELETICPNGGANVVAVTTFGSSDNDVSIWGTCYEPGNVLDFCCVFDDTVGTTRVELNGTPSGDEALSFVYNHDLAREENLQPWDDDPVTGVIRGNAGADWIYGSDYAGSDYSENLYGQDGADQMFGHQGDDKLSGGDGPDNIQGEGGADLIWAGDGNDESFGGLGHDTICDASGYNYCADNQMTYMDGGDGNDKLWYEESENPNVPCPNVLLDPNSTAGVETTEDQCGDNSNFDVGQLPDSCELYLTVKPSQCENAN